ncbi:hypothetical protein LMG24238_06193 [Paraburkholderia sediminicola]|uniref:Uncharacterized protein n=1 Tax=Paraburkholderia sediminicola TaxID=458836 RepID=A0A6J5CG22_9BURK|nr:DUF2471 domain-containing protein [Paraburkholderia sediminicola]CAB3736078.1 hypothetical protein LMG24238_06193 [Paraburkholderia sediminicola]
MEVLFAADVAVKEAVPAVVSRHRSAGVLTWGLLQLIEAEVFAEIAATGKHSSGILAMLSAPVTLEYLKVGRAVSFDGHDFVPPMFGAIEQAWRHVN